MKLILRTRLRETRINRKNRIILIAFLTLTILFLSLGMIQGTLGKFSTSIVLSDSAIVSRFDIIITAPEELMSEYGESTFEIDFISGTDARTFCFDIFNNGETNVLCSPGVNNNIVYSVLISGINTDDFIVKPKETVSFELIIKPDGLSTNRTDVSLFIDIRQTGG